MDAERRRIDDIQKELDDMEMSQDFNEEKYHELNDELKEALDNYFTDHSCREYPQQWTYKD